MCLLLQAEEAGDVFALWRPLLFQEFARYIVSRDRHSNRNDYAWRPVTELCEVCKIDYEYILQSSFDERKYLTKVLKWVSQIDPSMKFETNCKITLSILSQLDNVA